MPDAGAATPCAARAAAAYEFFGRCQRLGLCYKLRMSSQSAADCCAGTVRVTTVPECHRQSPPQLPFMMRTRTRSSSSSSRSSSWLHTTHAMLGLSSLHASCCARNFRQCTTATSATAPAPAPASIPPASNGCQTAARQGGLGQAGRQAGGCCLGVHTIEVVHLAGMLACAPAPTVPRSVSRCLWPLPCPCPCPFICAFPDIMADAAKQSKEDDGDTRSRSRSHPPGT